MSRRLHCDDWKHEAARINRAHPCEVLPVEPAC